MKQFILLTCFVLSILFAHQPVTQASEPCDTWFQMLLYYEGERQFEQNIYDQLEAEWDVLVSTWADAKALWLAYPTQANYDAMVSAQITKEAKKAEVLTQYLRVLTIESYMSQITWYMQTDEC